MLPLSRCFCRKKDLSPEKFEGRRPIKEVTCILISYWLNMKKIYLIYYICYCHSTFGLIISLSSFTSSIRMSLVSKVSQSSRSEVSEYVSKHPPTFGTRIICQRRDVAGLLWEPSFDQVHTPTSWRWGQAWHSLPDQGHYEDCVSDTVAKDGNVDWHIWLPAMTSPNKDDMSLAGRSWSWFSGRCGKESLQGFCSSWRDVPDCHESGTRCVPAILDLSVRLTPNI